MLLNMVMMKISGGSSLAVKMEVWIENKKNTVLSFLHFFFWTYGAALNMGNVLIVFVI